ncbi:MAG: ribonuclease HIII [Verrucomicrobiae bacterium]|nr:ribonuclease HIII [Verrucomicrobiae bacterium]MDW7979270.1 ribonuclease HIII [Verrucomicrobiales bacterium]
MDARSSYVCNLTPAQAAALRDYLAQHGFEFRSAPHAEFAAQQPGLSLAYYTSGKLVVQGKGTREFVEFVLEPLILKEARLGYETVLNPELLQPRIGVDESGKGDFFGPLCVAAVYVNSAVVKAWQQSDIRDSKQIHSVAKLHELARLIRKTPGCVCALVTIGNEAYNRLHAKLGNVNSVLAWAHARAIENLLAQQDRLDPAPVRAISDQFAANPETLRSAMMRLGRQIELVQKHRAETDLAVAAASILARAEFLRRLALLEKQFGVALPRGASAAVEAAAREFVAKHGADALPKVAKMHFRTAARVCDAGPGSG